MKNYYSLRAQEYEKVYFREDTERQHEQRQIRDALQDHFKNKMVLEVACGTGYWTQFACETAEHITAVDYSEEVLALAKEKQLSNVTFDQADAYHLGSIPGHFNGGFSNFWFSHIPKSRIHEFLDQFHSKLSPDSSIFFADNMYMDSIGGTLIKKDNDENTYKIRTLENGSSYEVIKNYFTSDDLYGIFKPYARLLRIHIGQCFWWLTYQK